jgi:thiosulfate/3-mercaptopyruvate sulfurtransferase
MTTYTTLIEAEELAAPLARDGSATSGWAILDCRFDLGRPDWGASIYASGHIPGALYAHLDRDLAGPIAAHTGRHPLPPPQQLARTFGRWGIDANVQVVAYDQGNGAYAARLWWLLRWAGHRKVAVLNGGFAAWQQAGLPIDTTPGERPARSFTWLGTQATDRAPETGQGSESQIVTTAELERIVQSGDLRSGKLVLVDARAKDRFAGENETIDPVAGHIPGARNHPFSRNLDAHGRFLPADELRECWQATLGVSAADTIGLSAVMTMCGSGVTACHNLLALEVAGLPGARLYAGSWSEWIRDPGRPVALDASRPTTR